MNKEPPHFIYSIRTCSSSRWGETIPALLFPPRPALDSVPVGRPAAEHASYLLAEETHPTSTLPGAQAQKESSALTPKWVGNSESRHQRSGAPGFALSPALSPSFCLHHLPVPESYRGEEGTAAVPPECVMRVLGWQDRRTEGERDRERKPPKRSRKGKAEKEGEKGKGEKGEKRGHRGRLGGDRGEAHILHV